MLPILLTTSMVPHQQIVCPCELYIIQSASWVCRRTPSSEPRMMDQLSASKQLVAALLLVACVATHFGAASAQYGNSGAAGMGPSDGSGYYLGVAAAAVAVAAFVWN
ncbi:unnamed protein product [Urochloa humidicola]